jgi:hypothetical protein
LAALVALSAAALAAGCGDDAPGSGSSNTAAELTIVLGDATTSPPIEERWTLGCDPPSGDLPDPDAACAGLAELMDPWSPVPDDVVCAEIFGGPQTLKVTGSFGAEVIDATFTRTNACETERFDRIAAPLGIVLS